MATETQKVTPAKLTFTLVYLLLYPFVLLGLSGDWRWLEGWLFSIWFVTLSLGTVVYLYVKDPALLAERYRKPGTGEEARWDQYVVYGIFLLFLVWFIVMPLDAKRFHWTSGFPVWATGVGAILLLVSSFFIFRAFAENTYLSPLVRIQSERHHQIISTGVYGLVRHPMYLGAVCMFLGAPLFLGSRYGLLVGLLLVFLLMVRIVGEEALLVSRLDGYSDYRCQVKYRLIPYVW